MSFLDKFREKVSHFMSGRYGSDQLNLTLVILALVFTLIGSLTGIRMVTTLIADALLVFCFYRMLSKDRVRRAHENTVYLEKTYGVRKAISEWFQRLKNARKYRYFVCPKCKERLRVPRGVGKITITCKKCGEKFDGKA